MQQEEYKPNSGNCEGLKFDHLDKYYLLKWECVLENKTHNLSSIFRYKQNTRTWLEDQTLCQDQGKRTCHQVTIVVKTDYFLKWN